MIAEIPLLNEKMNGTGIVVPPQECAFYSVKRSVGYVQMRKGI